MINSWKIARFLPWPVSEVEAMIFGFLGYGTNIVGFFVMGKYFLLVLLLLLPII